MSDEGQRSPAPGQDEALYRPIEQTGPGFYLGVGVLLAIILFGVYRYLRQFFLGLGETGMNEPVSWGFYIINFVFFIGISHAGTLISAILRLNQAEWRRPITRMAEVITAIVLAIGGLHPIIDLGRPDRILNIFKWGRLQSPLLWDVMSITAYFAASTVYLYLPLIPDIARLRDRGVRPHWLYDFLSWQWQGTPRQVHVLSRAMNLLMILVIPIAVSVHTVISYIFAMTLEAGWHSTIFGPYFVAGAIFSGIAALLVVMIVFRKVYHLEGYLKQVHFANLSKLLLAMSAIWFYLTFSEYLTGFFGQEPTELSVMMFKFTGPYAIPFWMMIFLNFVVPVSLLSRRKTRTIPVILLVSIGIVVGMWIERLIIVVPSLSVPFADFPRHAYWPSLTEISLLAAALAVFCLAFMLFAKFFPLISIWEIEEGREAAVRETSERVASYQPDDAPEDPPASGPLPEGAS
ncbi:MAG: NrfD/PsrC family molybdoenzyme membrane anchor subunit [Myxococcota bacterium]